MASSYNAPFNFGSSPGFGSGWTNLAEYLNQSNLNAVSGLKEEPIWDPGNPDSPYQQLNATEFDTWLFKNKFPTGHPDSKPAYVAPSNEGTGTTGTGNTGTTGNPNGLNEPLDPRRGRPVTGGNRFPRQYTP